MGDKDKYAADSYVIFDDKAMAKFINSKDKGWTQVMTAQDVISDEDLDVVRMDIIPANTRLITFKFKDPKNNKLSVGMVAARLPGKVGEKEPVFPAKLSDALNGGVTYQSWPNVLHVAFKSETNLLRVLEDMYFDDTMDVRGFSGMESFTFPRYDREQWADENGESASLLYSLAPERMKSYYVDTYDVDRTKEYVIRFLYSGIPDVSAVFLINGRRFACKELKVCVVNGKRQKFLEGVFYAFRS